MWVWFDTGDLAGLAERVAGLSVQGDDASVLLSLWHRLDALSLVEAIAFASCRSWRGPEADGRWVEIDLLTGEAVSK